MLEQEELQKIIDQKNKEIEEKNNTIDILNRKRHILNSKVGRLQGKLQVLSQENESSEQKIYKKKAEKLVPMRIFFS